MLEPLGPFRDQFSIFSGLDHRGRNGHEGWKAWMSGYASGSVSMDQMVAAHVGDSDRVVGRIEDQLMTGAGMELS